MADTQQLKGLRLIFFLSAFVLLLVGCSSGGGGSRSAPAPVAPAPPTTGLAEQANAELAGMTADSEPRAGSVTQGSSIETIGDARVTADTVTYSCTNGQTCRLQVAVGGESSPLILNVQGEGASNGFSRRLTTEELKMGFPASFEIDHPVAGRSYVLQEDAAAVGADGNGGIFALTLSDVESEGVGDDHLSFGIWAYDMDQDGPLPTVLGVFADGEEFTGALPTTGSATYTGKTFGISGISGEDGVSDLVGDVTLEADFGAASVSGMINNLHIQGGGDERFSLLGDGITVMLGAADIDGIFFKGDTSIAPGSGITGEGKWGGQFFGGAPTDGETTPPLIGGTWGATVDVPESGDDPAQTIEAIGAFGAWLN